MHFYCKVHFWCTVKFSAQFPLSANISFNAKCLLSTKCTFSLKCSVSAKCSFIANWTFCAKFSFSAKSQFEICPKVHTNIYTIWYYFNSIQVCCLFLSWMEYQFLSWGIFWIYSESKMELFGFLSNIKFYIYWMEFRFFPYFFLDITG